MTHGADIERVSMEAFNISDEMLEEFDALDELCIEARIDPFDGQNIPEGK